jgi:ubiquinone/menaquinone biosynthesis C-methylase UbiE
VVLAFAQQRVTFLRTVLGDPLPSSALDVGCGDGFGMMHMKALVAQIHGCDRSPKMLEQNPAPREALTQCDANQLVWEEGAFELVYCWELLHHVQDPLRVVKQMARVARKTVLLCEPNCLNPAMAAFGVLKPWERGLLRFTPGYTHGLLVKAGLREVRSFTVGNFTPNRTPLWLATVLGKLPYRVPLLGLYTIAVGEKPPLV